MKKHAIPRGMEEKLLEDIIDDIEKEGGEWITLSKTPTTLNPPARDTIDKDNHLTSLVEHLNLGSPEMREAFSKEDAVEGLPTNGIESFPEIKFEES
jgi:hypothetical protein